jgi:hypothetical protein
MLTADTDSWYRQLILTADVDSWYRQLILTSDTDSWYWLLILTADTDSWPPKYWEINLSQCHTVRHKPDVDWPGCEPGSAMRQARKYQSWKTMYCASYWCILSRTCIGVAAEIVGPILVSVTRRRWVLYPNFERYLCRLCAHYCPLWDGLWLYPAIPDESRVNSFKPGKKIFSFSLHFTAPTVAFQLYITLLVWK